MVDQVALEVDGVSKRYGSRDALCSVDLVAQPGRLHALLGPNGAGKTTLLRVALGLVAPDAGTVRLLGHRLESIAGQLPDAVAGFVETPAFYPYLSGRRNLALLSRLDGINASARLDRVSHVLEQVGLSAQSDVDVAGYSAGMRQRLGLAAALLRAPQLLLLDEPTSSLDPAGAREVRVLARRLVQQGVAVLLSSHDMSEVEQLCDALTIIDGGRVIFSGTADQLRKLAGDAVHALRTSNDDAAIDLSSGRSGIRVVRDTEGIGLVASADIEALDAYVVALGRAGIAIRALEHRGDSLEALFLRLTGQHGGANEPAWREGSGGPRASRAAS